MNKIAVISGVGGMDGFHLSKLLLSFDYMVVGIVRRSASDNQWRLEEIKKHPKFKLVYGDITDAASIDKIVNDYLPHEFYHLAANSFVGCSWASPTHVIETNTIGTINCLEAIRKNKRDCKFYFASSSESYGDYVKRQPHKEVVLDENSPMIAASPYGVSKVAGYQLTKVYRESYNMFASCGILFNHCSPLRGTEFFTRKVTSQLARIKHGKQDLLNLGNLDAKRDEGFSGDYVRAIYLMLQHNIPDDFVIASGETHSCQEWLDLSLDYFNLTHDVVRLDTNLFRPNEVNVLIGNASKAKDLLGWTPNVPYKDLNRMMCECDDHVEGKVR